MFRRMTFGIRSVLTILTFSAVASASTITIATPGGATEPAGGNPVSASATFTTSTNTVMIDLNNLLSASDMKTVAQALSDLSFTLSGTFATGLVNDTNRVYSGRLIDVGANGVVSTDAGNGIAASYNGWDFSNTGSLFLLEDLGSAAGPAQTIIGGTSGSNTAYSNAGGSIASNGPHNPFLQGTAHFVLTIAGVTANTTVTGATFSFGTELGDNVPGTNTPEPISLALVGTGLLSLALLRRRQAAK